MVASAGYGKNVMDFLCGSGSAFGQTFFAQRVRGNITVTDAFPCASVFFVYIRCTLVLVILASLLYAVFLAVLTVCKVGAAGVSAGTFRFSWHDAPPFAHEKTATGFLP